MEIKISLDSTADLPFLKKLLSQIEGISEIEILKEKKGFTWEQIEDSEDFRQLLLQSEKDFEEGRYVAHSEELMDSIFNRK